MSNGINKVILIGNLGADPEFRSFDNGGEVANLSIATSETWTDKQTNERKEKTEWHNISVTDERLVDICRKYLKKGKKIYIEGQLQTRNYEKDGQTHYRTDVAVRPFNGKLQMLDSRNSEDQVDNNQAGYQNNSQGQNNGGGYNGGNSNGNGGRQAAPPNNSSNNDDFYGEDVPF